MYEYHIQLKTAEALPDAGAAGWYKCVEEFGPDDVIQSYDYEGSEVAMEYGMCSSCDEFKHVYTVPLKRNLTSYETLVILNAWEYIYPEDFDIEISGDLDMEAANDEAAEVSISDEVRESVVRDIHKFRHNRWVESKLGEGWRWSGAFSSKNKTHPGLRDWDNLNEDMRRGTEVSDREILEWLHNRRII